MKDPIFKNHGIQAKALVELVLNTAPFLLTDLKEKGSEPQYCYLQILNAAAQSTDPEIEKLDTDLWGYFELAIAAHFATVGTFVPTDVDLAIRQKLWKFVHGAQAMEKMWDLVLDFSRWNEDLVSARIARTASGKKLSGHQGEWFSIAMGAYGCALKASPEFLPEIRQTIEKQFAQQEEALTELRTAFLADSTIQTAIPYLDGIAAVSHNLGDLDRMFEIWKIEDTDVLKRRVFRAGHEDARVPKEVLVQAGQIYQSMLANENHRHFALREPKGIRKSSRFLLNYGPFMDEWGIRLVKEGLEPGVLDEHDFREVVEALVQGWNRLNAKSIYLAQGYARALCGIASALPRKATDLENFLPPVVRKGLTESGLKTLMGVSRTQFENQWVRKLLIVLSARK